MSRIADVLEIAAKDDDFPVKEFENGDVTYIIKKVRRDAAKQTVTILLETADKNAPDTRYVNHSTKTKRDFNKAKDEGGGHSAHLVVSLTSEKSGDNVYVCLMEKAPNFPEQRVCSVLNTAIRIVCQGGAHFEYQKPGGSKKQVAYVPHLELHGHASYELQRDLEEGKINSITLIEPDAAKPLGQGKYFSGAEKYMKVKMLRKPNKGGTLAAIKDAARSQSRDYSKVRISFKPDDKGQSTHVDLDSQTGSLLSAGYVKTKHFGSISPPITTSAVDDIVPHLESRMIIELLKERS